MVARFYSGSGGSKTTSAMADPTSIASATPTPSNGRGNNTSFIIVTIIFPVGLLILLLSACVFRPKRSRRNIQHPPHPDDWKHDDDYDSVRRRVRTGYGTHSEQRRDIECIEMKGWTIDLEVGTGASRVNSIPKPLATRTAGSSTVRVGGIQPRTAARTVGSGTVRVGGIPPRRATVPTTSPFEQTRFPTIQDHFEEHEMPMFTATTAPDAERGSRPQPASSISSLRTTVSPTTAPGTQREARPSNPPAPEETWVTATVNGTSGGSNSAYTSGPTSKYLSEATRRGPFITVTPHIPRRPVPVRPTRVDEIVGEAAPAYHSLQGVEHIAMPPPAYSGN